MRLGCAQQNSQIEGSYTVSCGNKKDNSQFQELGCYATIQKVSLVQACSNIRRDLLETPEFNSYITPLMIMIQVKFLKPVRNFISDNERFILAGRQ